jgi:hypothetical protein
LRVPIFPVAKNRIDGSHYEAINLRGWNLVGANVTSDGRERHVQKREACRQPRDFGIYVEQAGGEFAQYIVDLLSEPRSFFPHWVGPTGAHEVLSPMQEHDAGSLEISSDGSRQRQRCFDRSPKRVFFIEAARERVLKEGGLLKPEPAEELVSRMEAVIERPTRRTDLGCNFTHGGRTRSARGDNLRRSVQYRVMRELGSPWHCRSTSILDKNQLN